MSTDSFILDAVKQRVFNRLKDEFNYHLQVDDIFDGTNITKHCRENYLPEDIFSDEQLTEWAIENGYVKKEDV